MKSKDKKLEITVLEVQKFLSLEYGDKFLWADDKKRIWKQMLSDFERETILAAVYHLVSIGGPFPPVIGEIRRRCADIAMGELLVLSAPEAWERVSEKIHGKDITLNDDESKALRQTGSLYDLRHSQNPIANRTYFVKAYEAIIEKRMMQRYTMPNVARMIESNTPALPARQPVPAKQEDKGAEEPITQEQIKNLCNGLFERMG